VDVRFLLLLVALFGCDTQQSSTSMHDAAEPGEGWVDGGGLLMPPLGATLSVSGADQDGLRLWLVSLGERLDCDSQREHDAAVEAANEAWLVDGDHEALQAAIAAADVALFPPGTWMLRLDLGRRQSAVDSLNVDDVRLFGERRSDDGVDLEFTSQGPGVDAFDSSDSHAAGQLGFGAVWTGEPVEDGYYDFTLGFDARVCE
jgi:hypothetical protein